MIHRLLTSRRAALAPGSPPRGRRSAPGARAQLGRAVALAAVAALVVLVAGGATALAGGTTYEASVEVIVTPASGASDPDAAALFDTLSKGQVAATAAEIYRQRRWLGGRHGSVEAGVVAPSAVVHVAARASSPAAAQDLVQAVVAAAGPTVQRAIDPYAVSRLDSAVPSVEPVGMARALKLALALLAAAVAGAAVLRVSYPKPKLHTA